MLRKKYDWSGFYISINLPTFFFLCTKLCADNVNFVQRTTTTLFEQRQLCKDNDNFVRTMFTLCMNNVNFVRTTSTLQGQWILCTNDVHTLYEQRQLCKDNDSFVRTMSTLQGQRQLCQNNVHTCPNSAESTMRKREISDWLEQPSEIVGYCKLWQTIPVTELPVV